MTTKNDIITAVLEKHDLTRKAATEIVSEVFANIEDSLAAGEKVSITGFGSFEVHDRKERKGRNPQTGEELVIPATKAATFHAGERLRKAVKD